MPKCSPDRDRVPDERVSLHGPDLEAVLRALLKVDPDAEPDTTDEDRNTPKD